MIVFTTAYEEYAVEGFKVDALDYLLKPFGMGDVLRAADKVKRQYDLIHAASMSPMDADDALFLKTDYKVVRILVSDIIYVEGMAEYLRIHVSSQPKPLVVLFSMKKMEERLEGHSFMRIHKSYIINLRHLSEINKSRGGARQWHRLARGRQLSLAAQRLHFGEVSWQGVGTLNPPFPSDHRLGKSVNGMVTDG